MHENRNAEEPRLAVQLLHQALAALDADEEHLAGAYVVTALATLDRQGDSGRDSTN